MRMARQARQISPTGYYHVMMRGNNRETIFIKKSQKLYFIDSLRALSIEEAIRIVAYALMDNHVHIAVKGEIGNISSAIKKLNIKYAIKYNKDTKRIGHVFQDRYRSEIIVDDKYLLQVVRYIHNNPVKANIVGSPEEYRWSSYNEYKNGHFEIVDKSQGDFIMGYFSGKFNLFKKYHLEDDLTEFLDTREEAEANKMARARKLIEDYLVTQGVTDIKQIYENTGNLRNILVGILLKESTLSHRQIANLLGISASAVHRINLDASGG